jgi:hypothetical protein
VKLFAPASGGFSVCLVFAAVAGRAGSFAAPGAVVWADTAPIVQASTSDATPSRRLDMVFYASDIS